jgi:hypothetical protein
MATHTLPPLAAPTSSPTLQARPDDPRPAPLPPARIVVRITFDPVEQAELNAITRTTRAGAGHLILLFFAFAALASAGALSIVGRALVTALHRSLS